MKAISIRQPWAWLIVNGFKDIENRTWPTKFRGPVLIHASKGMTTSEYEDVEDALDPTCILHDRDLSPLGIVLPPMNQLERGGIVGIANITDCVEKSRSPWYMGPYGFVLADQRVLPFTPMRGMLGFFDCPDSGVLKQGE
jgi:hypothetical protein